MSGNIKVVVRCRPLNSREISRGATMILRMEGNQTILARPDANGKPTDDIKPFTFDKSYWSADKADSTYATQEMVYQDLGEELLDNAFKGFNACIFAYGQTGSGKSYSMMGYGEEKGIIPKTCNALFEKINAKSEPNLTYCVEVSYIEIYNEKVRDLLNPKNKENLKVREHPSLGPYVEDLSKLIVNNFADIDHLMDEGNKARTVAATNMNETSSRSHAVFTVLLTQKRHDELTKLETEKVSRISLVDLAGSERANSTGATGQRLKEGANINKSLTTLGKVIAALAEQSAAAAPAKGKKAKEVFVPYRDSILTWLLKDSLGGNSKTAMIAAVSPASDNYDETLSTLRYADQAKKIKNKAIVNEDPNAKLIRDLKQELDLLRNKLMHYAPDEVQAITASSVHGGSGSGANEGSISPTSARAVAKEIEMLGTDGVVRKMTREEVVDQLQASEKILNELNETWESKLKKTEEIHIEREKALEELGIAVEKNQVGVYTPRKMPHLVNLNEDPLMSECLVYQLKPGITRVGQLESETNADIRLSGSRILEEHCYFENSNGGVTIFPQGDSMSMVNGLRINKPRRLRSGFRIILGDYHVFRFNHPEEVRRERDLQKQAVTGEAVKAMGSDLNPEHEGLELARPESPSGSVTSETVDWKYARREAYINNYGREANLGGMKDEELDQLFDDVAKVRMLRRQGRPDSRADLDDDLESRGSGSSFHGKSNGTLVDDESVFSGGSTIVSAEYEEKLKNTKELMSELMQQQLELQKQEYEEKMHTLEQGEQNEETEIKLRLVKDEMQKLLEQQKEEYELKLKRMSLGGPLLEAKKFSSEFPGYTEDEVRMVKMVLDKWRNLRSVHMAETVLTNAVVLKEANIISRELSKQVVYQFVVIEGEFTNPLSFWESTAALSQFNNNEDTELTSSVKPCVGVKVIDSKHQVVYYWSLEKLKLRLHRMRNLYNFIDRPLYRKHFNWEDPFYENPCPRYTFIGSASVGLLNLLVQRPYESSVVVISRITGEVQGYLRVLVSPILTSNGQTTATSEASETTLTTSSSSSPYLVHVGQQLLFEVQILELGGLQEKEFSQVHVQFKLSSFGNFMSHSQGEKIFATEPVSDFEDTPVYFGYSQTLSMTVTQGMMDVMKTGMLSFEVFGHGQPKALEKLEKWDDMKERHNKEISSVNGNSGTAPIANGKHHPLELGLDPKHLNGDLQRRPEEELLAEERHDILAWVQVCELAPDGEYVPVQVIANNSTDGGVFTLRQGLQRRIVLTLSHTSGQQFLWNKIVRVSIGRARLLDAKGRITESAGHDDILVNLLPNQKVVYNRDGTSSLIAQGAWDSSLHDSLYLNRTTAANSRVLLTLTWYIEAEKCLEPIHFQMDIAVQIQGRDSRNPSKLSNLLASTKVLWKTSGVFLVALKPPMTRKLGELWRMNTASKYVRGEEFLANWRPRGVSLIQDYLKIGELSRRREAVDLTRQAIDLHNEERENEGIDEESSNVQDEKTQAALVQKSLDLWRKKFGSSGEIIISQDPPPPNPLDPDTWKQSKPAQKLIAEVKIVNPTENVSKKGFLMYPENADDIWVKRWFVIRRPYIYIYGNQSESDEQGVINLSSARVDYKKDLEDMLDRRNVFALYTNNNAYLFHAPSRNEMIDWIQKVDQFYPIQTLQTVSTPPEVDL